MSPSFLDPPYVFGFIFVSSILIFQCHAHLLGQSVALKEANLDHPPPFFWGSNLTEISTVGRLSGWFRVFFFLILNKKFRERERER
jgi:hypothetical protein